MDFDVLLILNLSGTFLVKYRSNKQVKSLELKTTLITAVSNTLVNVASSFDTQTNLIEEPAIFSFIFFITFTYLLKLSLPFKFIHNSHFWQLDI